MINRSSLFSSAYFPPVHYMAAIAAADEILIEKEESYLKQSYRNRCLILTANGVLPLSVPVLLGSFHKTPLKDIKIDYSKRWQQVHLGAINSSYRASPFYEYYHEKINGVIEAGHEYLIDLNMNSLEVLMNIIGINATVNYTSFFRIPGNEESDFRYTISPKKQNTDHTFSFKPYQQVFSDRSGFAAGLSALDLVFNTGPDSLKYLIRN